MPPSIVTAADDLVITPEACKAVSDKSSDKLPAVFEGLDKAEALAYVSRLFDAAHAGAVLWEDKLLLKRFLDQCSGTGSQETKDGYRRELRHFTGWRDQHHRDRNQAPEEADGTGQQIPLILPLPAAVGSISFVMYCKTQTKPGVSKPRAMHFH